MRSLPLRNGVPFDARTTREVEQTRDMKNHKQKKPPKKKDESGTKEGT
jgi:hypothetical protein